MNYRTALITIMVILSGLFITCTSAITFCNDIPIGAPINNGLFSLERLALGGIGFPGETGSIEMTDEILERIRTSPEYEDRLNAGFIIELSSDDEKTYYEIFPGGAGYREIAPESNQEIAVSPNRIGAFPGFLNNPLTGIRGSPGFASVREIGSPREYVPFGYPTLSVSHSACGALSDERISLLENQYRRVPAADIVTGYLSGKDGELIH